MADMRQEMIEIWVPCKPCLGTGQVAISKGPPVGMGQKIVNLAGPPEACSACNLNGHGPHAGYVREFIPIDTLASRAAT
jgi:hypothetical protein